MSNNKQSMKLYTEKEVVKLLDKYTVLTKIGAEFYLNKMNPIELPSDEEIERELESHTHMTLELGSGFIAGANYIINKIQGGNKWATINKVIFKFTL